MRKVGQKRRRRWKPKWGEDEVGMGKEAERTVT